MAKTSDVAADAAVPSSADIERAAAFAREPFLLDGEGPEALAPGTARRRALDAALAELDEGAEDPSIQWRRDFSLLLGLERLLADETPKLLDGAELNPHQVAALSGPLTELMAEQQTAAENGLPPALEDDENEEEAAVETDADDAPVEEAEDDAPVEDDEDGEEEEDDEDGEDDGENGASAGEELEEPEELAPEEEPQDWEEPAAEEDAEEA